VLVQRRAQHFEELAQVADLLVGDLKDILPV
jgi:hypothetical protein